MNKLLEGKVALVTGAAMGFGWGIARGLAQAGAHVCIVDIVADELERAAADVSAEGPCPLVIPGDVSDFRFMQSVVDQIVAHWGRLDLVVNNAAIMPSVSFEETTPELWRKILAVNLDGVYNGVRAAWYQMKQQGGGHCVAIASGSSVRASLREAAYATGKHALEGFTKAIAREGEPFGIAANTMGPGKPIKRTSITRETIDSIPADLRASWVDPISLAPAFVWLALQPPARYTGLRFDAGRIADTVAAEGYDFTFAPEKVTLYAADLTQRIADRANWPTRE